MQLLTFQSNKMNPEIILKIITEFPDAPFESKNQNKVSSNDFTAISTPPGCPQGSTDPEEPIKFDFLGLQCDHQVLKQLEQKKLSKTSIFNEFLLFLRGFLVLAALKLDGRIPNLEIQILQVLPDLQIPMGTLGAY